MPTPYTTADIAPWTQAIAGLNQFIFSTNWTANAATDIVVYNRLPNVDANDVVQLVDSSDYTVQFVGDEAIVQVTFIVPPAQYNIVTITRNTPSDFLNTYTNTNFTPSMLNGDFERLTLIDQQNELKSTQYAPHYNASASVVLQSDIGGFGGDEILPILGANEFWVKDEDNIEFVPFNITDITLATTGPYLIYKADDALTQAFNLGLLTTGLLKQTVTLGVSVPSIAVNGVDYYGPDFTGYLQSPAGVKDINGNIILGFTSGASNVNHFVMQTQPSGQGPILVSQGGDSNIPMTFFAKGSGNFNFQTTAFQPISIESGTALQHTTIFQFADTLASRTITFPDVSGTVAFTSDLTGYVTSVSGTSNRITSTGGTSPVIDISASYAGQSSITTLGTIGTGTWQGTLINPAFGGTGISNLSGSTITLGGALTLSGAFTTAFNITGNTSVTFPISGTLATTAGTVSSVSGTLNRITSTGGTTPVIDISASYVGQSSITTLGTIATGVWQGTLLSSTYGGTGVNNGSNTLTLAGNLATSGAFASTFTMTGATNVTFPTTGTLATTATASGIVNSGLINQLAYYAAAGTALSGVTIVNSAALTTTSGGVPTWVAYTGTGAPVLATSPTLVTPILGAASATSISFSSTSGIIGTTTNNAAAAGSVGEIISSSILFASAVSISSGDTTAKMSIPLTAGDWDVYGSVSYSGNVLTTVTQVGGGLGIVDSTTPPDRSIFFSLPMQSFAAFANSTSLCFNVPSITVKVANATTQTVWLIPQITFAVSTASFCGFIYARRRR